MSRPSGSLAIGIFQLVNKVRNMPVKKLLLLLALVASPAWAQQSPPVDMQKLSARAQAAALLVQELLEDHNALAQEVLRLRGENAKLKAPPVPDEKK